jgi:DUF4097 and DUF4098 domain-containing protein YvlB
MESRNRNVWIVAAIVLVLVCCCLAVAAAGAAAWFLSWPSGCCGESGVEGGQVVRAFEVGSSPNLKVDNFAGSVTVRAGEGGEIQVVATKHARRSSDLERIEVEMVEQGGGLLVKTRKPRRLNNAWVKLEITAPAGTRLDADTGSGNVGVSGFDGGVRVDTGSGSVTVRNLKGDVEVHTGTGSVEARDVEGRLKVDTGSGRVTIEGMTGESEAHTGSGGIDVHGARGSGRFDTGSGSIDYQGSPQGDCRFNTGSGSINLRLPADLNARVDLHTGSGSIDVAYAVDGLVSGKDVQGVIGSGDGATIYARTGTGSIDLIRY